MRARTRLSSPQVSTHTVRDLGSRTPPERESEPHKYNASKLPHLQVRCPLVPLSSLIKWLNTISNLLAKCIAYYLFLPAETRLATNVYFIHVVYLSQQFCECGLIRCKSPQRKVVLLSLSLCTDISKYQISSHELLYSRKMVLFNYLVPALFFNVSPLTYHKHETTLIYQHRQQ